MKKPLFTLTLLALATNQAMAGAYRVEILDQPSGLYNTEARVITEDGRIAGNLSARYEFDGGDDENSTDDDSYQDRLGLISSDSLKSTADTFGVASFFAASYVFVNDPDLQLIPGFGSDEEGLTVTSTLADIVGDLVALRSTAPRRTTEFTDSDGDTQTLVIRDFAQRGLLNDGENQQQALPSFTWPDTVNGISAEDNLGGSSAINSLSNTWAVGFGSVSFTEDGQSRFDDCNRENLDTHPLICLETAGLVNQAHAWPVSNGQLGEPLVLAGLTEPQGDESEDVFISVAHGVNDQGLAVGRSVGRHDGSLIRLATLFDLNGGSAIEAITPAGNGLLTSTAFDITNSGWVVGNATFDGTSDLDRFFIYNTDSKELAYPDTFYNGANSVAFAVNEAGLAVGAADWEELPPTVQRRRHAFIYDAIAKTFTDLNEQTVFDASLVSQQYGGDGCAAREDWTLVEASDINEAGEIAATAVTTFRDANGELVLDDDGNKQYVIRAVRLVPDANAEAPVCVPEEQEPFKRSGGSLGWGLALLSLLGLRRRLA
ncbi:DUF3466 family protein [Gallaecimonas sp. GXIMD4217]|uniref:DUF3466 family protein n=1 Tax=Gallaecimonas sp. GXIMD4217 TaxID=3131927 RepID=UPI00311B3BA5